MKGRALYRAQRRRPILSLPRDCFASASRRNLVQLLSRSSQSFIWAIVSNRQSASSFTREKQGLKELTEKEIPPPVLPNQDVIAILTCQPLPPRARSSLLTDEVRIFERAEASLDSLLLLDALKHNALEAINCGSVRPPGSYAPVGNVVVVPRRRVRVDRRP